MSLKAPAFMEERFQMRRFPTEESRSIEVQQNLALYFALAERIQNFWLTQARTELASSKVSAFVFNVACSLDIQAMRQFRSVEEECRRCEAFVANIIARSMFETILAQQFILARRLCIVVEQKTDKLGRPEFFADGTPKYRARLPSKRAKPKRSDWLSRDLRAQLYWSHIAFQDLRALDRLATGKRMKKKSQSLKDGIGTTFVDECAREIGQEWTSILKESDSYSGLSIADLAKHLLKGFGRWQQTVYFLQCRDTHATNASQHLTVEGNELQARFLSSDREVAQVLWVTISMALINIKLMQKNINFGSEVGVALESLERSFRALRGKNHA